MPQGFNLRSSLVGVCLCALFAGCGGSQLATSTSSIAAVPKSRASVTHSWMDRTASEHSLLYVSSGNDVYVYTYPEGHFVGTLTGFISPLGECVDSAGDVFIVTLANESASSSIIYEYAHGGTQPISTLNDPAGAEGCVIDPISGNLAVANGADPNNPYGDYGDVAVYPDAQGKPTMYYSSEFGFQLCGYDIKGNLYVSAINGSHAKEQLVRLAKGTSTFKQISLNVTIYTQGMVPSVQWDGKHMTVSSALAKKPVYVYRLRISGDSGVVVGTTTLSSKKNTLKSGQIWIQGNDVLRADYFIGKGGIDSWSYPKAAQPRTIVGNKAYLSPFGIAVSSAASQ